MAYIWENYNQNNYYYIPKHSQSYYEEIWEHGDKYIPVNIYNRFMDVFFPESLVDERDKIFELGDKYKSDIRYGDIVNLVLHQMVFLDRIRGITLDEIKMLVVYEEIMRGLFGTDIKKRVDELEFQDLYILLMEYIKKQYRTDILFDEVLHLLFDKVLIYYEKSSGKTMVYIEHLRNAYRENLMHIVEVLFADIDLDIEVFWANEHFGVIGNYTTMAIDRMNIY